jgi:invasion protein IalB
MTDKYEWPAVVMFMGLVGLVAILAVQSQRDPPRQAAVKAKQEAFVLECIDSGRDAQTCWEIVRLRGTP